MNPLKDLDIAMPYSKDPELLGWNSELGEWGLFGEKKNYENLCNERRVMDQPSNKEC